ADWCVADEYSKANHQPVARILGESVRTVRPGEKIILDASPSFDPDKNSLSYQWWQYREAGSVQTKVAIKHVDEKRTEIIVPDNPGKQLHLILELTDNGTPNLKSYKRVILNVN
ncbi:REJ domain-containing protein, partial [Bacteroides sp.]